MNMLDKNKNIKTDLIGFTLHSKELLCIHTDV